jgi:hypothetical protein
MYRVVPEHGNHEATITKDGQTCLEMYLDTPNIKRRLWYEIVVLDYRMPRPDSIGVAKRVLEAKRWFDRWRVFEVDKDGRIQLYATISITAGPSPHHQMIPLPTTRRSSSPSPDWPPSPSFSERMVHKPMV